MEARSQLEPQRLLEGLSRPEAYPHPVDGVRVVQTHISAVFLAGPYAYKLKKPVDFGFVDFRTPERRRYFCHEEVRLNRRLAPTVYHGVVPIVEEAGRLRIPALLLHDTSTTRSIDPGGNIVDWAVRMTRLPQERTLKSLLRSGEMDAGGAASLLGRIASLLARFHAGAARSDEISRLGGFQAVAANARDNFEELQELTGPTLSRAVLGLLSRHSRHELARLRPLIEKRARAGVPCDGHGDLRLGHIYHLRDGTTDRIVIIDCIEFNERFRCADPVADIAFLAMELEFEGRPDLARAFSASHVDATGDPEGGALLPYYMAYRDIVRGKVRTLTARDVAIPRDEREKAVARAKRHFLRALGRLAPPAERPFLMVVGGLPGVGKSVLARELARKARCVWMDTDEVRRRITAGGGGPFLEAGFEEGRYTPEWTDRTYEECLREAESRLFEGGRVVVEGSFRTRRHRAAFVEAARDLGVPGLVIICEAEREVVHRRLLQRSRSGAGETASEADWTVYQEMERRWEPVERGAPRVHRVRTDRSQPEVLTDALRLLREADLW